ncbi:hypothetical protein CAPN008_18930 [Capnocytophaga canis]|uniref:UDP-2,4-diacetamido-2,4, 6-trideoxy-beta-L-altropyranose hydrolase n=1 Tax=Capnocytophaga canis TaxID=1848903 RepID=UPI001AD2C566|nr:UDP-2,4-diacetamido-2,4,6-trideoxy-beta-L-altropyranose hydrolase [Capnocytophaga canis]GIM61843.1 hypothetical protein CAPN008_18930 [Capnocytophaga canis]
MKIIFRADGNSNIGLGHLFRLFALVEIYKDVYDYVFITKESSSLNVFPSKCNLRLIPESIDIQSESNWLFEQYSPEEYIVIADGYHFDSNYQKTIKDKNYFLMYIDDLATEYMYADIVINHSPFIKEKDFKSEAYTRFALGTDYAMLRSSFLEIAKEDREIKTIETAFVCFGGADFYDLTYKAVRALLCFEQFKRINVVLGGAYKHTKILELQDDRLEMYRNLGEMELLNLMISSNFAIAPTSTIFFELCCVKMPILGGYYVDNQKKLSEFFMKQKLMFQTEELNLENINFKKELERCLLLDFDEMIIEQKRLFDRQQKNNLMKLISFAGR